jgi:acylphosphatase
MADLARARMHVRGVVQGVGYRYFVRRTATAMGLSGWVRNRFDGSVEVVAEGERSVLEAFSRELEQGPRFAEVDSVDLQWEEAEGRFRGFEYAF